MNHATLRKFGIAIVGLLLTCPVLGDETSQRLAEVARKTEGALAMVTVTMSAEMGGRTFGGPGVCIDAENGVFMTLAISANVRTEDIQKVQLVLPGIAARSIDAKLLGIDPSTGLGFVRAAEKHPFQQVRFAARSNLQPGEQVFSSGLLLNMPGYPPQLGTGYVSSQFRMPDHIVLVTGGSLGSACSPVFTAEGKAVGIVGRQLFLDQQAASRRGPQNLALKGVNRTAFFTPVEEFIHVLERIPTGGKVGRLSWIGVNTFQSVPDDLNTLGATAIKVVKVIPETPAARAGLADGDIIVSVDGEPIPRLGSETLTRTNFVREIFRRPAGSQMQVTVVRAGQRKDLTIALAPMPATPAEAPRGVSRPLGFAVREKVMLDQYEDVPTAEVEGLVVIAVGNNTLAGAAGLQTGDVITKIGGRWVKTIGDFDEAVEPAVRARQPLPMVIHRGESPINITIPIPPANP